MYLLSFPNTLSTGTSLALRLEDHLSWLRAEQIEVIGTPSERAALQATINDVNRLLQKFVC